MKVCIVHDNPLVVEFIKNRLLGRVDEGIDFHVFNRIGREDWEKLKDCAIVIGDMPLSAFHSLLYGNDYRSPVYIHLELDKDVKSMDEVEKKVVYVVLQPWREEYMVNFTAIREKQLVHYLLQDILEKEETENEELALRNS